MTDDELYVPKSPGASNRDVPKKYRKKPVEIQALRLGWDTWEEMCEFVNVGPDHATQPHGVWVTPEGRISDADGPGYTIGLVIPTFEGEMLARVNDWVIRGIKNELYPCKPDIFAATYELVES
jgi:hypothetical protein